MSFINFDDFVTPFREFTNSFSSRRLNNKPIEQKKLKKKLSKLEEENKFLKKMLRKKLNK